MFEVLRLLGRSVELYMFSFRGSDSLLTIHVSVCARDSIEAMLTLERSRELFAKRVDAALRARHVKAVNLAFVTCAEAELITKLSATTGSKATLRKHVLGILKNFKSSVLSTDDHPIADATQLFSTVLVARVLKAQKMA